MVEKSAVFAGQTRNPLDDWEGSVGVKRTDVVIDDCGGTGARVLRGRHITGRQKCTGLIPVCFWKEHQGHPHLIIGLNAMPIKKIQRTSGLGNA